MTTADTSELQQKHCKPCHGETPPLSAEQAQQLLSAVPQWRMSKDGKAIERRWVARDFRTAMEFLNKVAEIAEQEDHHPDLHLIGYRNVTIQLTTHALDGLSENDFIMAAKIDALPIALKT